MCAGASLAMHAGVAAVGSQRCGRIPAARGQVVVLRIEPLRVSTLTGFHPSRNTGRPAAPAVMAKAALPVAVDRGP